MTNVKFMKKPADFILVFSYNPPTSCSCVDNQFQGRVGIGCF